MIMFQLEDLFIFKHNINLMNESIKKLPIRAMAKYTYMFNYKKDVI